MTDAPAKKRIEAIDLIKGLAIIAVVLGHVLVDRGFLNAWVYSFQVPLFFFAAGLVFSAKPAEGGPYAGFGAFVVKKLRQLMLPYAVFGLVAIVIYLALGALAASILGRGEADLSLLDCLYGLLYGNAALPQLYFYRPLWFLPCLFVMEVLAGALAFP
ncbi:MAG: acyltransferase family protein, partial [Eggerthellaceae bacterium]|nr:acyltransferase family protein [Eggerthellaceae bacterium]